MLWFMLCLTGQELEPSMFLAIALRSRNDLYLGDCMPFVKKFPCPECGYDELDFLAYAKYKGDSKFHGKPYFKCRRCQTFTMNLEDEGIFIWDTGINEWILTVGKFVFR